MDDIICRTENQKGKPTKTAANGGRGKRNHFPVHHNDQVEFGILKKAMPFTIPLQNWGALVEM